MVFGPKIFTNHKRTTSPLISSHSDGKIINHIVNQFGYKTIAGSTNKESFLALKSIIKTLSDKCNIFITPDGPRGPIYEINSNITNIAKKYANKLIPVSCVASKYFTLKSWDKLIIPVPFSTIIVLIGNPVILSEDEITNNNRLKQDLLLISDKAEKILLGIYGK